MGGRGASSGISKYGNKYGSQYKTVAAEGNIKIVKARVPEAELLLETLTRGRVYGILNSKGDVGTIAYFDSEGKRSKRIDLDHSHKKLKPHVQHGYFGKGLDGNRGASKLTPKEKRMVDRVLRLWDTSKGGTSTNARTSTP